MSRPRSSVKIMRGALCSFLLLAALIFSGCSLSAKPSLAIVGDDSSPGEYAAVSKEDLLAAAEQLEFDAEILDASPQELATLIEQKEYSALLVCLSSGQDAADYIEAARPSLTPIIFCGAAPSEETLLSYDQCWYVGSNPQSEGELLGQALFACYENGQIPDKNADKLLQTLVVTFQSTADDRIFSVLRIFENQGIYSDDPVVLSVSSKEEQELTALLEESLAANPQTDLVLIADPKLLSSSISVCAEKGVPAALCGAAKGRTELKDTPSLLACSGFDPEYAADLVVTYAGNASLGKDPTDGTGERLSESRCTYLEPLILYTASTPESVEE